MVCLVTGSSRGLGRAAALAFGREGHRVAVHYRNEKDRAREVASQINDSLVVQADVRHMSEVRTLVDTVLNRWGRIDVLVNNAGITVGSLLVNTSEQDFEDVVNTNLKGAFNFIRTAGRSMMKQKGGHIINIASYVGMKGKKGLSAYSSSKAGLIGLTKTGARELCRYSIMVNAVLPGYMLTDMGTGATGKAREIALSESMIKDYSDPFRAAEFILWLSGTTGITGQVFNLDSRIL